MHTAAYGQAWNTICRAQIQHLDKSVNVYCKHSPINSLKRIISPEKSLSDSPPQCARFYCTMNGKTEPWAHVACLEVMFAVPKTSFYAYCILWHVCVLQSLYKPKTTLTPVPKVPKRRYDPEKLLVKIQTIENTSRILFHMSKLDTTFRCGAQRNEIATRRCTSKML